MIGPTITWTPRLELLLIEKKSRMMGWSQMILNQQLAMTLDAMLLDSQRDLLNELMGDRRRERCGTSPQSS